MNVTGRLAPWAVSLFLVAALLTGAGPAPAATAPAEFEPSFFNTRELRSSNMAPFKQWNSALEKYSKERAEALKGSCDSKNFNACNYQKLTQFLDSIRGKDKLIQLKAVNELLNKARYITDEQNWGVKEYWSSPGEFMARFGDCEDYAIAKFVALGILGFPAKDLRVVAVKDLNLKVGHAVLVVFLDGKTYVLDNQITQVVEAHTIRHYEPVFSINRNFWWRHVR
jgi:predicted transglutaminase-like cysteine proteinase